MSTGEDLAFLGQEHRVELAKDHLQGEKDIKQAHVYYHQDFFLNNKFYYYGGGGGTV